jgi:hypothetical protein
MTILLDPSVPKDAKIEYLKARPEIMSVRRRPETTMDAIVEQLSGLYSLLGSSLPENAINLALEKAYDEIFNSNLTNPLFEVREIESDKSSSYKTFRTFLYRWLSYPRNKDNMDKYKEIIDSLRPDKNKYPIERHRDFINLKEENAFSSERKVTGDANDFFISIIEANSDADKKANIVIGLINTPHYDDNKYTQAENLIREEKDSVVLVKIFDGLAKKSFNDFIPPYDILFANPNFPIKKISECLYSNNSLIRIMAIDSGRIPLDVLEKEITNNEDLIETIVNNDGNIYLKRAILKRKTLAEYNLKLIYSSSVPKDAKIEYLNARPEIIIKDFYDLGENITSKTIEKLMDIYDILGSSLPIKVIDICLDYLNKKLLSDEDDVSEVRDNTIVSIIRGREGLRSLLESWFDRKNGGKAPEGFKKIYKNAYSNGSYFAGADNLPKTYSFLKKYFEEETNGFFDNAGRHYIKNFANYNLSSLNPTQIKNRTSMLVFIDKKIEQGDKYFISLIEDAIKSNLSLYVGLDYLEKELSTGNNDNWASEINKHLIKDGSIANGLSRIVEKMTVERTPYQNLFLDGLISQMNRTKLLSFLIMDIYDQFIKKSDLSEKEREFIEVCRKTQNLASRTKTTNPISPDSKEYKEPEAEEYEEVEEEKREIKDRASSKIKIYKVANTYTEEMKKKVRGISNEISRHTKELETTDDINLLRAFYDLRVKPFVKLSNEDFDTNRSISLLSILPMQHAFKNPNLPQDIIEDISKTNNTYCFRFLVESGKASLESLQKAMQKDSNFSTIIAGSSKNIAAIRSLLKKRIADPASIYALVNSSVPKDAKIEYLNARPDIVKMYGENVSDLFIALVAHLRESMPLKVIDIFLENYNSSFSVLLNDIDAISDESSRNYILEVICNWFDRKNGGEANSVFKNFFNECLGFRGLNYIYNRYPPLEKYYIKYLDAFENVPHIKLLSFMDEPSMPEDMRAWLKNRLESKSFNDLFNVVDGLLERGYELNSFAANFATKKIEAGEANDWTAIIVKYLAAYGGENYFLKEFNGWIKNVILSNSNTKLKNLFLKSIISCLNVNTYVTPFIQSVVRDLEKNTTGLTDLEKLALEKAKEKMDMYDSKAKEKMDVYFNGLFNVVDELKTSSSDLNWYKTAKTITAQVAINSEEEFYKQLNDLYVKCREKAIEFCRNINDSKQLVWLYRWLFSDYYEFEILEYVLKHPNFPFEIAEKDYIYGNLSRACSLSCLASTNRLSDGFYDRLLANNDKEILSNSAIEPDAPIIFLRKILGKKAFNLHSIRAFISPRCPQDAKINWLNSIPNIFDLILKLEYRNERTNAIKEINKIGVQNVNQISTKITDNLFNLYEREDSRLLDDISMSHPHAGILKLFDSQRIEGWLNRTGHNKIPKTIYKHFLTGCVTLGFKNISKKIIKFIEDNKEELYKDGVFNNLYFPPLEEMSPSFASWVKDKLEKEEYAPWVKTLSSRIVEHNSILIPKFAEDYVIKKLEENNSTWLISIVENSKRGGREFFAPFLKKWLNERANKGDEIGEIIKDILGYDFKPITSESLTNINWYKSASQDLSQKLQSEFTEEEFNKKLNSLDNFSVEFETFCYNITDSKQLIWLYKYIKNNLDKYRNNVLLVQVFCRILGHPNFSFEIAEKDYLSGRLSYDLLIMYVKRFTTEFVDRLLSNNDEGLLTLIVMNKETPIIFLRKILGKKALNLASRYAFMSPRCPQDAKVNWINSAPISFTQESLNGKSMTNIAIPFMKYVFALKDKLSTKVTDKLFYEINKQALGVEVTWVINLRNDGELLEILDNRLEEWVNRTNKGVIPEGIYRYFISDPLSVGREINSGLIKFVEKNKERLFKDEILDAWFRGGCVGESKMPSSFISWLKDKLEKEEHRPWVEQINKWMIRSDYFIIPNFAEGWIRKKLEENCPEKWLKEIYQALERKRMIPYFIESWVMERSKIDDEIGKTLANLYKNRNNENPYPKINWHKIRGASKMSQLSEKPEDKIGSGEISATKLITLLHEIEYKNHLLSQVAENAIHPKRRENIQNRLGYFANRYFEYLKDFIIKGFNQWKDIHPIEDSEKWADMVMDTHEDITNWNNFFKEYNMQWGGCELSLREIPLDKVTAKEYILSLDQEEILYSMELYFREKSINKEPSADLIGDDFIEWYVENMDNYPYSKLIDERGIHYAIKEILYKSYVQVWGEDVRKIIANVNEAIKRLEDVSNKGEEASISEMTAAISLALNVQHVAGTIMVDLIPDDYIISNVNTDFLDNLSKLDVSNWEKEFHEEFGV